MKRLQTPTKIYIKESTIKGAGRGVFASSVIKSGEVIETCPALEISNEDAALLSESIITSYLYFLGEHKEKTFLVLGYGSLYNHSYESNAEYRLGVENTVEFVAARDIEKDEEIVVNYNPQGKKGELWFEKTAQYNNEN